MGLRLQNALCLLQFYWQQLPATGFQCIYHARTSRDDYFNYTAPYGGEGSYLTYVAMPACWLQPCVSL